MPRWLVDGMNVIGTRPDRWWKDPGAAVRRLVDRLAAFADSTGEEVVAVFDLRPRDLEPGKRGGLEVAFATARGRDAADDEIARRLEVDDDPSSIRVVTSDRELARRAEARGAAVTSAGSFLERLDGVIDA